MLFRLKDKVGKHVSESGLEYSAGDIIESDKDLTKVFSGKFDKCADEFAEDNGRRLPNIQAPSDVDDDKADAPSSSSSSGKKSKKSKPKEPVEDVEVTSDYPAAEDIGVQVFKTVKANGDWYYITDPDDNDAKMNDKDLRKKSIKKFLKSITEE